VPSSFWFFFGERLSDPFHRRGQHGLPRKFPSVQKLAAVFMLPRFNLLPRSEHLSVDLRSIFEVQQPYFSFAAFPGGFQPCWFIEKYRQRIHAPAVQQRGTERKQSSVAKKQEYKRQRISAISLMN